ncbi:TonB-dependent receptor [Altericroceibacterium spongiae]|uniref:TonB-dependent receptor n=1 Tax=Altericroceibacterium spongiae TaxID=2320269 RepID=A0A420EKF7_9SPHN|nr:TonB-dependent receptor [Altericroceibacterium spongiae]RKF21167.1 TonB-dependent receptor [Altericroceibacterium spongiae]
MSTRFRFGACLVSLSYALSSTTQAWSQDAAEAPADTSEIVVTATRTDETLIDAPISATVLTEDFLRDARIQSLRQIDDYVPNVQFNQLGQVGGTYITIRGIESNPFIVNRAAVYIDGIPFRQPSDQALGFAEQVEVLRGPQGTLYGANTESGLILIRTRQPSDHPEIEATASAYRFGHGSGLQGRASIAGPITADTLAGSLVLTHDTADSYVRNRASSIDEEGKIHKTFVQGKLRWTPDSALTVDVIGYASLLRAPGLYEQEFLPMDRDRYDALYGAYNGGRRSGRYDLFHDAPKRTHENEYVLGANARYEFGWGNLDTSLSWRKVSDTSVGTDLDMTGSPATAGGHEDRDQYWNFEGRLSSPAAADVQWVLGINHYRDKRRKRLSTLVGTGGLDDYNYAPPQTSRARDTAGFAQVTVPVVPNLRLTGGLRYEHAARYKEQAEGSLSLGPAGEFTFPAEELEDSFDAVLPRVSIDWKPVETVTLYASAAKGWIPGGFNLAATGANIEGNFSSYDPERLWTYEVGFKASLANRRLLFGAALFHTDVDNWQEYNLLYTDTGQVASTTLITSTARVRTRGFEVELTGKPTRRLDIAASLGVVDAKYREYQFGIDQDFAGNRVKLVPRWDASLSASWRPWKGLYLRGEANGTGASSLRADSAAWQDAYWLANLQIGWEAEHWDLRLYADNLTDERAFVTSAYTNSLFGYDGTYYAGVGAPRVVGIEMGLKW